MDIVGMCPVARLKGDIRKDPQWQMVRSICAAYAGDGRKASRELDGALAREIAPKIDVLLAQRALLDDQFSLSEQQELHADVAPLVAGVPEPDELFNSGDLAVLLRMLFEDLRFGMPGNQFNIGDSIGEGEAALVEELVLDAVRRLSETEALELLGMV